MKKISIIMLLLILTTLNVKAVENNGVQEVKTGIAALFTFDNDGDGIKDRDDLCKDSAVTSTHIDSDKDGCDDSTSAMLNEITPTSVEEEKDKVDKTKPEPEDVDGDGISDDLDGCVTHVPTIDNNENGCEDNTIRTMYTYSEADKESFTIKGVAFVDGQAFSTENAYTIEVEFYNQYGEYITGKVADNYLDDSVNEITGTTEDISYSAFTITFDANDFAGLCAEDTECTDSQKNDEAIYTVNATLTDQEGQKYTETLYSFDESDQGNNSGVVRVEVIDHRVYLTVK